MINIHTMLTGNWKDTDRHMNYTYDAGKLLTEDLN